VRYSLPESFIAPLFKFCLVDLEILCNDTLDHFFRIKMFLCNEIYDATVSWTWERENPFVDSVGWEVSRKIQRSLYLLPFLYVQLTSRLKSGNACYHSVLNTLSSLLQFTHVKNKFGEL